MSDFSQESHTTLLDGHFLSVFFLGEREGTKSGGKDYKGKKALKQRL